MRRALLFDLDDTLVVDEAAAAAAFAAGARSAAAHHPGIDVPALAGGARARARELWRAAPTHPYCARIGISSWEGLWCRFLGDDPDVRALRAFAVGYRPRAWSLALLDQGIEDPDLALVLGERFGHERRARHAAFADARDVLARLSGSHALVLVTNGASCLQREKLEAAGLAEYFEGVVVSAEIGVGKPDRAMFERALTAAGCAASDAVMVGDSLERDVRGALDAGVPAVWVNRSARPVPEDLDPATFVQISRLDELPAALERLDGIARPGPGPGDGYRP